MTMNEWNSLANTELSRSIMEFETRVPTPARVREDLDSGLLTCTCDAAQKARVQWCEHIEKVIKNNWDACPPGQVPLLALGAMPENIVVPVVPSNDLWVAVLLGPLEDGFRSVHADEGSGHVSSHDGIVRRPPDGDLINDLFLGYIGAGEGRMTIRSMIFEWMRPYSYKLSCNQKIHKQTRWSKRDSRATPLSPNDWASLWCLMAYRICKDCLTYTADISQDAPQL